MKTRPPFDRALLIPIAIGVVSILGIAWILSISDLGQALVRPTAIPTTVGPLEPDALTPPAAFPTGDETSPTATDLPPTASPRPPTVTLTSTSTPEPLPTPSATYTPEFKSLRAGQYDDTNPNIVYDRFWTVLKTGGTANAFKAAIHSSGSIGSEASFRFTGKGFILGYQRGKNFGTVTVIIDGQTYGFNEQDVRLLWRSPELPSSDHFVRIIHESGESINIDYLVILE